MKLSVDAYAGSIRKYGETECGDIAQVIRTQDGVIAILADGLGSGLRANLLASVTVRMLTSMLERGEPLSAAVDTVVASLPVSPERGLSYAAFTVMRFTEDGELQLTLMNMPAPVILRRGVPLPFETVRRTVGGRTVVDAELQLRTGDMVAAFSDGVTNAGTGGELRIGWQRAHVEKYLRSAYRPSVPAEKLARLLLNVSDSLYGNRPGDDLSVLVLKAAPARSAREIA